MTESKEKAYSRVLVKISGEFLSSGGEHKRISNALDMDIIASLIQEIISVREEGVSVCLVVGGGNIFRGVEMVRMGMDRYNADAAGMLVTVINALALQSMCERYGVPSRVMSAIPIGSICESYVRQRALRFLDSNQVLIFAAGLGAPHFSTDTAAALRASEMGCDLLIKATKVDGVYSQDPIHHPNAKRYKHLTYRDVLSRDLQVMDVAAVSLARDAQTDIAVCAMREKGWLKKVINQQGRYTLISDTVS